MLPYEDPPERPAQDARLVVREDHSGSWSTVMYALLLAAGLIGLGLVAAAPLGLVDPYPPLPPAAIEGPLGSTRALEDPSELDRREGEALPEYFDRLARVVGEVTVHYWHRAAVWEESDVPFTRVSPWVNYVLWIIDSYPRVGEFRTRYQFLTPTLALDRGYGFCSQWARTIYSILRDQGIAASVMQNDGHVVVESNGCVIDGDYGVVVPFPLARIVEDPAVVAPYYEDFPDRIPMLMQVYARPWKRAASDSEFDFIREFEKQSERVKWLLPAAVAMVGAIGLIINPKRRETA